MEYKKIICPIDFSDFSRRALEVAAELAKRFDADLHVIHIFQLPAVALPYAMYEMPRELEDKIKHELSDKLNEFIEETDTATVNITCGLGQGIPDAEILSAANKHEADIIVMGSRGRTGLARILLGSVAERVIRFADVHVMIVRE